MKRIVFFYLMTDKPDLVHKKAPLHVEYWHRMTLPGYEGGPFADWSGGCIVFKVESLDVAEDIINHDPFMTADCLAEYHIKEWQTED